MTPGGPANETGCSARYGGLAWRAASVWLPRLQGGARNEMGEIVVSENVRLDGADIQSVTCPRDARHGTAPWPGSKPHERTTLTLSESCGGLLGVG